MTANNDEEHWKTLALDIYSGLAKSRSYALTDEASTALGALAHAWKDAGNSFASEENGRARFAKFLSDELAPLAPGFLQERPSDPVQLPKPWVDPVTGEILPNPYVIKDTNGQRILGKRDPALAAHYRAMAKDPHGTIARLQDEQAARLHLSSIKYDAEAHKENPYVNGNLTEQGQLAKRDPIAADFYKREAQPLALPWQLGARNLTGMGKLAKNPSVRAVVARAEEIQRVWATQAMSFARTQMEQAQQTAERMQRQLARK